MDVLGRGVGVRLEHDVGGRDLTGLVVGQRSGQLLRVSGDNRDLTQRLSEATALLAEAERRQATGAPAPAPGVRDDAAGVARQLLDRVEPLVGAELACLYLVDDDSRTATGLIGRAGRREFDWIPDVRIDLDNEPSGVATAAFEATPVAVYDAHASKIVSPRLVEATGGPSWYSEYNVLTGLSARSYGRFMFNVTRIAAGRVERGLYVVGDKSWSIDMQRFNFQFTGQRFYRIADGELVGQVRDVAYQATTTDFWGSMEAVGGPQTWELHGAFNCGKAQPGQVAAVSHGCPTSLFRDVRILNTTDEAGH